MTITIKQLKERIKDLPDDMPVILVDANDDDEEGGGSYEISESDLGVDPVTRRENDEEIHAFTICFKNKHLPDLHQ